MEVPDKHNNAQWQTPQRRVLLKKLTVPQLVKKFPVFCGTQWCISAFTRAHQLSLTWTRSIQSMPSQPVSSWSILILYSHLQPGLPNGLFPSGFLTKTLHAPLLYPICVTCPTNPILLDLITWIIFGKEYKPWSSSLCSFLQCPVNSSHLDVNIFLSTLFSSILNLCSSHCETQSFTPI